MSSIYRILAEHAQVKDRRRLARHPARARPELIATGPGQVFTWDITKLRGPSKGDYFDAYVMIDIYSRYIVGACVHATETAILAEHMMREVFTTHGTPQIVHADRGTSMTSKRRVQAVEACWLMSSVNTSEGFFQWWILRGRSLISAATAAR